MKMEVRVEKVKNEANPQDIAANVSEISNFENNIMKENRRKI